MKTHFSPFLALLNESEVEYSYSFIHYSIIIIIMDSFMDACVCGGLKDITIRAEKRFGIHRKITANRFGMTHGSLNDDRILICTL